MRRQGQNAIFKITFCFLCQLNQPTFRPIDPHSAKMKFNKPAFIALISMILIGIGIFGFLEIRSRTAIPRYRPDHQILESNGERSASISLGTILLLLAVGISGALSVRRKKKKEIQSVPKIKSQTSSDDRSQAFVKLNKQYLNLQYKITQNKITGDHPPNHLLKEISDLERKVRLISRALE